MHTITSPTVQSENVVAYTAKVMPEGAQRARHVELDENYIVQLAREILRKRHTVSPRTFTNPNHVREVLGDWFMGCEREEFVIVLLDSQHRQLHIETVFTGTINAAPVYPREIIKLVLRYNAAAVILAHNHPSGEPEPSDADKRVTTRIEEALRTIDVNLLDHFVMTSDGTDRAVSFAERDWL